MEKDYVEFTFKYNMLFTFNKMKKKNLVSRNGIFFKNKQLIKIFCRRQWQPTPVLLLGNPMDGGGWWAAFHRVARSQTPLSDFTFTFMHWRRKWQPTPVFLPGESQGWGSLVGCRLWGHTESDTTEATQQQQQQQDFLEG